ncbi:hypothetical protein ACI2L4_10180 [Streptomyces sparsogenes]|uniref:hypothetical protein n=1 Tax=Streptomyces sparsogenes TaxID=67365 RepID=UPI00385082E8
MITTTWPPSLRDGPGMAHAYAHLLGWPIWVDSERVGPEQVAHVVAERQPSAVTTVCSGFDAVQVPYIPGRHALVTAERKGAVPCLRADRRAFTLFVEPGTGRSIADLAGSGLKILSGDEARIELPPTPGVLWDTPPWHVDEAQAVKLRAAGDLRKALVDALHLYPRPRGEW